MISLSLRDKSHSPSRPGKQLGLEAMLSMQPTEEQLTALGNYRDIIIQQASKIAEAIGVSQQTLTGWTQGEGEPTSEQAADILNFLTESTKLR
jgi:transcriptional regulator with XRE-family HTH domain